MREGGREGGREGERVSEWVGGCYGHGPIYLAAGGQLHAQVYEDRKLGPITYQTLY